MKSRLKRTESMVQFKSNADLILKPWIQYFSKLKSIINWMNYNFDTNIRAEICNTERNNQEDALRKNLLLEYGTY